MNFLRLVTITGSVFLITACSLSASVDVLNKGTVTAASTTTLTLVNAPTGVSAATTLNATVTSSVAAFYKYKVGSFATTDCSVVTPAYYAG